MFEEINLNAEVINTRIADGKTQNHSPQELNNKQLVSFAESISQMVLVLNNQRQILYSNKSYNDFFEKKHIKPVIGEKLGNSFKCKNAIYSDKGCGSTKSCKTCGAANAITESLKGNSSTKDCKILTTHNETIDLRVTSCPLTIDNDELILFSITDISHEKRRKSLERVFIHDILNIAGGISGLSAIMKEVEDPHEMKQIADTIENASNNLIEEIQSQRELGSAERGDLTLHYTNLQTLDVLEELKKIYSNHEVNNGKKISIRHSGNYTMLTDKVLLKRILGNMIKNALEAIAPDDYITLSCTGLGMKVRFEVHNRSIIPDEIKNDLFKRYYSTKQNGRGIGTYSMKLFGEKYLKGRVWFTSSPENGTSFYLELNV